MDKYRFKITDIIEETAGTKTYLLEKPIDFTWAEGAHTHIGIPGFDEGEKPNKDLVRHMSITTLPGEGKVGFTTRMWPPRSEFKERLSKLHIGDEVILFKIGSRMSLRREERRIVLVSMGVGMATMRPLIYRFLEDMTHIPEVININVNSAGDFVYRKELDKLECSGYRNFWMDSRGAFYEVLDKVSAQGEALFYVVGSDGFIKEVLHSLKSKGVPESNILIDKKEELLADYFSEWG